jgi:hypothetical protein
MKMLTLLTDDSADLSCTSQVNKVYASDQSSWQAFGTFVISLQSRYLAGRIKHRTILYCLDSGERKVFYDLKADDIYQFVREQSIKADGQKDDKDFRLTGPLPGSQPEANIYRPLKINYASEAMSKYCDGTIESVTDELELVDKLEHFLQQDLAAPPQMRSYAHETVSSPTEDGQELSTEDQSELTSEQEVEEVLTSTSGDAILSEEESPYEEEPAEPLKLEITQVKFYLPLELDDTSEPDDESEEIETFEEEAETSDVEEQEQAQVIVVNAATRVLIGELPKAKSLEVEVIFQLKGERAIELTQQQLPYHTEVYGENRTTNQKLTLGYAPVGTLVGGELTYTCRLEEVSLPDTGSYRLQFISRLEDALVSPDLLELPFVQVA